ncbi:hypothetical protein Mgra_00005238 [Meloidogyne graminicola]|uniref:Uncharacterized protein n=1 Tax=Meloidogyne graminicola TaxID=189291 RepID=A0A8S9ZPT9_9BILA|nr:hypothetical protein Mgra_00005238 [Meloidogyne graminicola]
MEMEPITIVNENMGPWSFSRGSNFLMEIQFWSTYITFTLNCIWTMDFTFGRNVYFAFEDIYLLTIEGSNDIELVENIQLLPPDFGTNEQNWKIELRTGDGIMVRGNVKKERSEFKQFYGLKVSLRQLSILDHTSLLLKLIVDIERKIILLGNDLYVSKSLPFDNQHSLSYGEQFEVYFYWDKSSHFEVWLNNQHLDFVFGDTPIYAIQLDRLDPNEKYPYLVQVSGEVDMDDITPIFVVQQTPIESKINMLDSINKPVLKIHGKVMPYDVDDIYSINEQRTFSISFFQEGFDMDTLRPTLVEKQVSFSASFSANKTDSISISRINPNNFRIEQITNLPKSLISMGKDFYFEFGAIDTNRGYFKINKIFYIPYDFASSVGGINKIIVDGYVLLLDIVF